VLGQIDPGPGHYAIQAERAARWPEFGPPPDPPPAPYFDGWRTECELADRIVVNSDWSRELLVAAGVDGGRISVVPLPYDQPLATAGSRSYPAAFSADRPLRVLFVGTASVTKGVPELLHAIDLLRGAPIELTLVGGVALTTPRRFAADRRIRWAGAVDRRRVMSYYRESDVLVFPSHSDGFGMAQVEAQAWWLPIIASRRCGRVVRDGETGWLLGDVTPTAIADALDQAMASPAVLARYADAARGLAEAGFQDLSDGLARLESE
jgi:glycosyltransferase involved in cell wall biosynthesis